MKRVRKRRRGRTRRWRRRIPIEGRGVRIGEREREYKTVEEGVSRECGAGE